MRKSIISIALVLCILFAVASPFAVHAAEPETYIVPNYQMYQNFMADTYPVLFRDRLYLATLDSSTSLGKYIDTASMIIGEDLSVERCTQLLANMATLMNYQLEEAIVEQATMDTTMTLCDYGVKAADIAAGVVGTDTLNKAANSVMEGIATTMGIANGVLNIAVDTKEELELLVQLEGDYSMQYDFLETVYMYADIPEMKEAAQTLMLANEQIMLHKLEVFNSTTASTTKFAAHDVFLDQVAEDLLNDPDFFDSDAWLGVKALSTAYSLYSGAKLAFDITLFLGDVMFGVHDIYNRYNEMVAMRDIRQALLSRVEANPALNEEDYDNMDRNISLMKMSLFIDARGEYCAYKMITEDGKLAKLFSTTNQKSIEDNYNDSVLLIENSFENLEKLYCKKGWDNAPSRRKLTQINQYDAAGNLTAQEYFHYTESGQLVRIINKWYGEYSDEVETVITYDDSDRLISIITGDSQYENYGLKYIYDSGGKLISRLQWEGGGSEATYEYDASGRLIRVFEEYDIGNEVMTYSYDSDGLLNSTEAICTELDEIIEKEVTTYRYDSQRRLVETVAMNGSSQTKSIYSYNAKGELTDIHHSGENFEGWQSYIDPFVIYEYDNTSTNYHSLSLTIESDAGFDLYSLHCENPQLLYDSEGYLAQVISTNNKTGQSTRIYEFYYDDVKAQVRLSEDAMIDAYMKALLQYPEGAEYTLYDIDKDGLSELIVHSDGYSVHTFTGSDAVLCGSCYPYHDGLYTFDGNGLIVHHGGSGRLHFEYVTLYKLSDYILVGEEIVSTEEASYDEIDDYLSEHSKIADFYSVSDYSLLELKLA